MIKKLTKIESKTHYYKDGKIFYGIHDGIRGDVSNISGNVSDIRGGVSDIRGDVSGISGNVSNISGNVSGISGNLDDCEITEEDRKKGIDIKDLIK
jgi:prophage DNA circulation protein